MSAHATTLSVSGVTCTSSGVAPNDTLTCTPNGSPPPAGAPTCGITTNVPNNTLPSGGGTVTVAMNCSGGTPPYTYKWNGLKDITQSVTYSISVTTTFAATATDSAGQANTQSVTVTVSSGGGGGGGAAGLGNCTNQGMSVLGGGQTNVSWAGGGNWPSSPNNFGDASVWVFQITPPAGTAPSTTLGRFAVSEYGGPPTFRQMTISTLPCDFRAKDYTGATGPLSVSNGTTATIDYGVGTPQFFGGIAYLTAGTTYYVSVRNWSVDLNSWSCGQTACNAVMNDQPASP